MKSVKSASEHHAAMMEVAADCARMHAEDKARQLAHSATEPTHVPSPVGVAPRQQIGNAADKR